MRGLVWGARMICACAAILAASENAGAQGKSTASSSGTETIASIVHRFYADSSLGDRSSVLTARFDKLLDTTPIPGALLPHGGRLVIREIARDSNRAVFETESGPEKRFADWYTYLVRDSGKWKIDDVRVFELPPVHYLILDSLEVKKNLPDSIAFVRDRMRLSASSNAVLKAHFAAHKAGFLKFASAFESHAAISGLDESGAMNPASSLPDSETKALTAQMHALDIGAALRKHDARQCVRYKIGGVDQTTVGYMHFGAGCSKPVMGKEDVMYMERVAPDWYVYRTG
jgi:hypothetical protein